MNIILPRRIHLGSPDSVKKANQDTEQKAACSFPFLPLSECINPTNLQRAFFVSSLAQKPH
jgi:hypothetical protein